MASFQINQQCCNQRDEAQPGPQGIRGHVGWGLAWVSCTAHFLPHYHWLGPVPLHNHCTWSPMPRRTCKAAQPGRPGRRSKGLGSHQGHNYQGGDLATVGTWDHTTLSFLSSISVACKEGVLKPAHGLSLSSKTLPRICVWGQGTGLCATCYGILCTLGATVHMECHLDKLSRF